MRLFSIAALVTAAAVLSCPAQAAAAPKDYCADLKGNSTGSTCEIQVSDPAYTVDISIPLDYPDQQPVADYISQTREAFINAAKAAGAQAKPSELKIKPTEYSSAIPPRGTQAVVFKVYRNVGGAQPQTTFKSFNWDQSYRKEIDYTAASDDKKHTPLWRVDDPLRVVAPVVQAELTKQQTPPPAGSPTPSPQPGQPATSAPPPASPVAQTALYNPANYQNFAVVNEGVIFFFDQGTLLPDAVQVLVPRSAIDPLLA